MLQESDVVVVALSLVFFAGWWLGRYGRDLYWTSKAWPSPDPTQACARGRLYWVADSGNAEDCERLLRHLERERDERARKRVNAAWPAATLFCLALLGCGDGDIRPPPYPLHFAADVPADERAAWLTSGDDWNVAIGDAVFLPGEGPATECGSIEIVVVEQGPDSWMAWTEMQQACVTRIRYLRGKAIPCATLQELGHHALGPRHVPGTVMDEHPCEYEPVVTPELAELVRARWGW